MLEILEYEIQLEQSNVGHCNKVAVSMLQTLVNEIVQMATSAFHKSSLAIINTLPVFISHCVYKAAMVYLQVPRQPGEGNAESTIRPLMDLLRLISTRWLAAGKFPTVYHRQALSTTNAQRGLC